MSGYSIGLEIKEIKYILANINVFKVINSLFLHQTLWSEHLLESSFQDDSNEWSHDRFEKKNMKFIMANIYLKH